MKKGNSEEGGLDNTEYPIHGKIPNIIIIYGNNEILKSLIPSESWQVFILFKGCIIMSDISSGYLRFLSHTIPALVPPEEGLK